MNDQNQQNPGSSILPPISNQRQLLIDVSGKDRGELLKDFSVVEDSETQPLYRTPSHQLLEDHPTSLKEFAATYAGQQRGLDGMTRDPGAKSPNGGNIEIALPITRQDSGYYHQSSSNHIEIQPIRQFIAPPGSLDEVMMAKVRKENIALENEARLRAGKKSKGWQKVGGQVDFLLEDIEENQAQIAIVANKAMEGPETAGGDGSNPQPYPSESLPKNARGTDMAKLNSNLNLGASPTKGQQIQNLGEKSGEGLKLAPQAANIIQKHYKILPGLNADKTDFKPEILDDIYEPWNKLSVDDCWINRDQDVMIIFNWEDQQLHHVDIKHNGVRIRNKTKKINREIFEQLRLMGNRQGFNFRISNNLDYLLIRYQNIIATAYIQSLERLFDKDFNLEEQLIETCKTIVFSDKEKNPKTTDPVQIQIASAIIDNDDQVIFSARRDNGQKKDLVIFHCNDKIEKIHNFLKNGLKKEDEYFSLNSRQGGPTFQDFPFIPESIAHSNLDVYFQHQRGCQYLFVVENQTLTKVYKPNKDERGLISVRHKKDVFKSNQIFYRTKDEALFIKSEQMILMYKYEGKFLAGGDKEQCFKEATRIVQTKKVLPSDSQLMKVYDKFIYTIKESDITIIDFENQKVVTTVKVVGIINQPMYQLQNSPSIVDRQGFHNVFYPEPLLTHHSTHIDPTEQLDINEYSSGIQINESLIKRHASRFLRTNFKNIIDIESQKKDEMKIVDYIPEHFIVLIAKQKKLNDGLALSDGIVLKKLDQPDLVIQKSDIMFGTLIFRGFLRESFEEISQYKRVNEQMSHSLFYITYHIEAHPTDSQIHYHQFKILTIPLDNISSLSQSELFNIEINSENSHLPIQSIMYCWKRQELFINYEPVNDKHVSELIQLHIAEGNIAVQTRFQLNQYIEKPIFFTDRLVYYCENISNALEIKKIKKSGGRFYFEEKPIKSYQSIINVFQIYRLYNIVLIHMSDDSLYLTDVDCYTIKTQITGLFNGVTCQDRSERNQIYVKNYEKRQVFSLNLFNNSPNSLPYQLLMKKGLFSQYDHNTRFIKFFRSVEQTSEVDIVSKIKVRSWSNPYMDLQKKQEKSKDRWWDMRVFIYPYLDILKKMKKLNIFDLLSYNVINRKHFIYEAVMFDDIFKKLIQLIEDLPETEHKPYIFPEVLNRDKALLEEWKIRQDHEEHDKEKDESDALSQLVLSADQNQKGAKKQEIQKYLVGAFDLAIELKERLIIQNLLNLMIISDPHGCLYSDLVAQNIKNFIVYKLSLKEYFSSSMPIVKHEMFDYPQFHNLDTSLHLAFNPTEHQSINDITTDNFYDMFMQPNLDKIQAWEDLNWFNKYLNPVRPALKFIRSKMEKCKRRSRKTPKQFFDNKMNAIYSEQNSAKLASLNKDQTQDKLLENSAKDLTAKKTNNHDMKFDKDKELYEIEYSLVNMPELLSGDQETCMSFMKLIQSEGDKDITFLEIPVIQNVINFKWQTYTEKFFIRQFIKTFLFILTFIIEIILTSPYGLTEEDANGSFTAHIITRAFCALMMLDHFRYEVRQLIANNAEQYFTKDYWNIFDVLMFVLYMSYIPIAFIYDNESYIVKIIQCTILLLFQIKFNFYLRIFDKFGFLVQMIVTVFYDLKYFLVYYLIIISFFSIQVSIIMKDVEDHDGIGPIMFFVMTLRSSLGDNDIDQQFSQYKILFWIVWFLIMVVGNIVLMNFIIAVVGQSYDNCMEKQVAQTYKTKVDMIVEREQMMSEEEFQRKAHKYFPKLILVRKIMDRDAIQAREEESRMEILTKEVRRISLSVQEIKTEQRTKTNDEIKEIKEMLHKIALKIDQQNKEQDLSAVTQHLSQKV